MLAALFGLHEILFRLGEQASKVLLGRCRHGRYSPGHRIGPAARSDHGLAGLGAVPHGEEPDTRRGPNCRREEGTWPTFDGDPPAWSRIGNALLAGIGRGASSLEARVASCSLAPGLQVIRWRPTKIGTVFRGPVVAELRRDGVVTVGEIRRAALAYLADPACAPFRFESGHTVDVAAAVAKHAATADALTDPMLKTKNRNVLVQAAIALGRTTLPE